MAQGTRLINPRERNHRGSSPWRRFQLDEGVLYAKRRTELRGRNKMTVESRKTWNSGSFYFGPFSRAGKLRRHETEREIASEDEVDHPNPGCPPSV